jgi:hypothetical protein
VLLLLLLLTYHLLTQSPHYRCLFCWFGESLRFGFGHFLFDGIVPVGVVCRRYYYWQLSMAALGDLQSVAEGETSINDAKRQINSFQTKSDLYYAFDSIQRCVTCPPTPVRQPLSVNPCALNPCALNPVR